MDRGQQRSEPFRSAQVPSAHGSLPPAVTEDYEAIVRKVRRYLDADDIRLLCYGLGIDVQRLLPFKDFFDGNTF